MNSVEILDDINSNSDKSIFKPQILWYCLKLWKFRFCFLSTCIADKTAYNICQSVGLWLFNSTLCCSPCQLSLPRCIVISAAVDPVGRGFVGFGWTPSATKKFFEAILVGRGLNLITTKKGHQIFGGKKTNPPQDNPGSTTDESPHSEWVDVGPFCCVVVIYCTLY